MRPGYPRNSRRLRWARPLAGGLGDSASAMGKVETFATRWLRHSGKLYDAHRAVPAPVSAMVSITRDALYRDRCSVIDSSRQLSCSAFVSLPDAH